MDASVEMKMQAIDRMLEMRRQIIDMQNNLGMWCGIGEESVILTYDTPAFFDIARCVEANVKAGIKTDVGLKVSFVYNGTFFATYLTPEEYRLYQNEINRGKSDD